MASTPIGASNQQQSVPTVAAGWLWATTFMAVSYPLLGLLSFSYSISFGVVSSAVFIPEGLSLALVLLFGPRVAIGIFAGQVALALMSGLSTVGSIALGLDNAFVAILAWAASRHLGLQTHFPRLRDYLILVLLSALLLQPISAAIGCFTVLEVGFLPAEDFWLAFSYWWYSNFAAQLTITPMVMLVWQVVRLPDRKAGLQQLGMITLLSSLTVYFVLYFLGQSERLHPILAFALIFPVMIVLSLRFHFVGAVVSGTVLALIAQVMTVKGLGPFTMESVTDRLMFLNMFTICIVTSSALVGITLQEKAAIQQLLEQQAGADALTGLDNRRKFFADADLAFKRAQRSGHPLGAIALDLDFFKRINDQYGHDVGDQVLVAFADMLKTQLRETDIKARLGGEEFIVVTTDCSDLAALAEKLRAGTQSIELQIRNQQIQLTVSCGVAQLSGDDEHIQALLKRADNNLYQAKSQGRNRVVA